MWRWRYPCTQHWVFSFHLGVSWLTIGHLGHRLFALLDKGSVLPCSDRSARSPPIPHWSRPHYLLLWTFPKSSSSVVPHNLHNHWFLKYTDSVNSNPRTKWQWIFLLNILLKVYLVSLMTIMTLFPLPLSLSAWLWCRYILVSSLP